MIDRALKPLLERRLKQFPAVTVVGARQSGKTTLARSLSTRYFNLEAPEERTRLDALWPEIMSGGTPVVFDEAQNWPELFQRLRGGRYHAIAANSRVA